MVRFAFRVGVVFLKLGCGSSFWKVFDINGTCLMQPTHSVPDVKDVQDDLIIKNNLTKIAVNSGALYILLPPLCTKFIWKVGERSS